MFAADRTLRSVLDALRAGRTTVSNSVTGPFLTLEGDLDGDSVFEAMGGDEILVASQRLHARASLRVRVQRGAGTAALPKVAAAGRDVWVVWQDERGHEQPHQPNIYLRHSRDGGASFGPALQLTHTAGRSIQPAIAVWGQHPVVAWADNSATGAFDVYAQVVGADAAPASGGTDPDNWQILASTRTRGTWGPAVRVSVSTTSSDRHPSVTTDSAGGLVVAWDSGALQSSGANLAVRASRSADGGLTWTPSAQVAFDPDAMSQRPRLSRDPDGTVRAVWFDSRSADWRWKLLTATFDPRAGWSDGSALTVAGNATYPAAAAGFVVFTGDRNALSQRDGTQQVFPGWFAPGGMLTVHRARLPGLIGWRAWPRQ